LVDLVLEPFQRFAQLESASGVLLLACALIALAWANSPWASAYHRLWEVEVRLAAGELVLQSTLHHLINDGLMAVFFFLVGLEIKREMLAGELASLRRAALPIAAALGGMLVPAALYSAINARGPGAAGWGIPMATDIAFALGVLALLGERVPPALRILLAALAIVDDIGAVLVIAVFYTGGISIGPLAAAATIFALAVTANAAGVRRPWAYGLIGLALWGTVLASGVHATVAGVLLAMAIPARTRIDKATFLSGAHRALNDLAARRGDVPGDGGLQQLEDLSEQAQAPLARIERGLHGLVAFGVMPLFALANAGVALRGGDLGAVLTGPVVVGIVLGLVIGKPLGITFFSWLAVRARLAMLSDRVTWGSLHGVAWLGGIGFTMALFIAGLAFEGNPELLTAAKVGILAASVVAGLGGWLMLRLQGSPRSSMSPAAVPAGPDQVG
jgi:NhaA family Na+:H+ antiporter